LTRPRFIAQAAELLGDINALHSFRDGNGRTQRAFLGQLAGEAGWNLDWDLVEPAENIAASIASLAGDNAPFEQIFTRMVTARGRPT
jgi:cell filamentation protein